MIPILKTARIGIKDLIFHNIKTKSVKKGQMWIVGFILLALACVLPNCLPNNIIGMIAGVGLVIIGLFALILIIPKVIQMVTSLVEKIPFFIL